MLDSRLPEPERRLHEAALAHVAAAGEDSERLRSRAAAERSLAARDREQAAEDRRQAAREREQSALDRGRAAAELPPPGNGNGDLSAAFRHAEALDAVNRAPEPPSPDRPED